MDLAPDKQAGIDALYVVLKSPYSYLPQEVLLERLEMLASPEVKEIFDAIDAAKARREAEDEATRIEDGVDTVRTPIA